MIIKKNAPAPLPHADLIIPKNERKTISTLLGNDCRWPFGDPLHRDFHFCGKPKKEGFPYCERHVRLSFQAKKPHHRPYAVGER